MALASDAAPGDRSPWLDRVRQDASGAG